MVARDRPPPIVNMLSTSWSGNMDLQNLDDFLRNLREREICEMAWALHEWLLRICKTVRAADLNSLLTLVLLLRRKGRSWQDKILFYLKMRFLNFETHNGVIKSVYRIFLNVKHLPLFSLLLIFISNIYYLSNILANFLYLSFLENIFFYPLSQIAATFASR